MTPREAFETIERELPFTSGVIEGDLHLVKDCVNKQIPKKVVFGDDEQDDICCPVCNFELAAADSYTYESCYFKHCPYCGQALDWSDNE